MRAIELVGAIEIRVDDGAGVLLTVGDEYWPLVDRIAELVPSAIVHQGQPACTCQRFVSMPLMASSDVVALLDPASSAIDRRATVLER